VGVSKTALYYYYPSKDELLFELVYGTLAAQAQGIHDAVADTDDGGQALRAIIRETVRGYAAQLDDFRLIYLHGQVAAPGALRWDSTQFERIRPLNDLSFAGAAKKLSDQRKERPGRAKVEPRLMAFLAQLAAIGVLTMKGMVERMDDPLLYSDEQLIEGLGRIFEAAAAP
jgi:AcrR family transcriptional regulator